MARDFDGVDDVLVTDLTAHSTTRTYIFWMWRDSLGEGSLGRLMDKRASGGTEVELIYINSAGEFEFLRAWSSQVGKWAITLPGTGAWNHFVVAYDAGSVSNVATWYLNGTAQSLVSSLAPTGTVSTNTDAYHIGNRGDLSRTWGGRIRGWGCYDRILTATEVAIVYAAGPLGLPYKPTRYYELLGSLSPEPDLYGSGAATVTGATQIDHGPRATLWIPQRAHKSATAAASAPTPRRRALLGVGS